MVRSHYSNVYSPLRSEDDVIGYVNVLAVSYKSVVDWLLSTSIPPSAL